MIEKCESKFCDEPKHCNHYCLRHHASICVQGESLAATRVEEARLTPFYASRILAVHDFMKRFSISNATFVSQAPAPHTYEYVYISDMEFQFGLKCDSLITYVVLASEFHPEENVTMPEVLETKHVHNLVKSGYAGMSAQCAVCGKYFGWWCPGSKDHLCHYSADDVSEDHCIYCGMPDERK